MSHFVIYDYYVHYTMNRFCSINKQNNKTLNRFSWLGYAKWFSDDSV